MPETVQKAGSGSQERASDEEGGVYLAGVDLKRASTIGFWGSLALLANNITGPGMVAIPATFQAAGWVFPTVSFLFTALYSTATCLLLAKALTQVPGNGRFQEQLEFSNLASTIFPQFAYKLTIFLLVLTFTAQNMSAIIESAQTMDSTFIALFGKTCALTVYSPDGSYYDAFKATGCPNTVPDSSVVSEWKNDADHGFSSMYTLCERVDNGTYAPHNHTGCVAGGNGDTCYETCCGVGSNCRPKCTLQTDWSAFTHQEVFGCVAGSSKVITDSPFGTDYVLSLGFLVTVILTVPLGFYDLESNVWVQIVGFFFLVYCCAAWVVQFFLVGLTTERLPAFKASGSTTVLANVMFNFGFVLTIPSWLNEKAPSVSATKAIWVSLVVSTIMFLALGLLGAAANIDYQGQDLLAAITTNKDSRGFATVAAYLFPPAALLTGIPVISIIVRYNLVENKITNKFWGNMIGVVMPWVLSLFFYTGSFLTNLMNWSSALLFVELNFIFPLLAYTLTKDTGKEGFRPLIKRESLANCHEEERREKITVIPQGWECIICYRSEKQLAWVLVWVGVVLSIATLAMQIIGVADPAF